MLGLLIGLPLISAILVKAIKSSSLILRISLVSTFLSLLLSLYFLYNDVNDLILFSLFKGQSLGFSIDSLARFFLVLTSFIFTLVSCYNLKYVKHLKNDKDYLFYFNLTIFAIYGLILAKNFVSLYMFFEVMTLVSFPLVLNTREEKSIKASVKYLAYSIFGATLVLFGYFLLSDELVTFEFSQLGLNTFSQSKDAYLGFFLMILGFSAKVGLYPLHSWLSSSHPVAPSSASAILSGIITKMGVFSVIRVGFYLVDPKVFVGSNLQNILLGLTIITILLGSLLASKENNLKKRLAFSTVSQTSYILFSLFLFSEIGFLGALLQVLFHSLVKNGLFLLAGILLNNGVSEVNDLEGLGKKLPITFSLIFLGGLSLIGIPPSGGFSAKWYIASASLSGSILGFIGLVALMISALLTAYYMLSIVIKGYFTTKKIKSIEKFSVLNVSPAILIIVSYFLGTNPSFIIEFIKMNIINSIF